MRQILRMAFLLVLAGSAAASCVVRERVVAQSPACRGGVWVPEHRGHHGRYHPGHWRCPGVVERIEIE